VAKVVRNFALDHEQTAMSAALIELCPRTWPLGWAGGRNVAPQATHRVPKSIDVAC
jgi:hypothetical protein